ncbi:MAG: Hopanoid biosynthesis associated rane protein HpnM [Rhodospirillales bacterium]|jgi:phospholipid transport system substrate-binding protein|nr:Hopanoid biosynthesis associated rane protein HpnM [Rhodospirillales bacterium]
MSGWTMLASRAGACAALVLFAAVSLWPAAGRAQADSPPARKVTQFHDGLLEVMKQAKQLGFEGRAKKLEPLLDKTFDLPLMARLAVGPQWSSLTPEQQKKISDAFRRLSIATFASRFDGYEPGQHFETLGQSPVEGSNDVTVDTQLVQPNDKPVKLSYRMRPSGSDWKAIDVYLDSAISELATRRSEFSGVLRSGGPDALLQTLEKKIAEQRT